MGKKEEKKIDEIESKKDTKEMKYWALGGTIVMLFVIIIALVPRNVVEKTPDKLAPFTQCLLDKGVKMYGAYWCSHCKAQKELFGKSWDLFLSGGGYVECDAKGANGNPALCQEKGITGYPTWHIPGENNTIGVMPGHYPLEDIAKYTGCSLGE